MLIESDNFPFEFISVIAERESWRKEVHRPIYHIHKWWAKRLGSVFRGVLLGSILPEEADLTSLFYKIHNYPNISIFDPFMGSGTTIGEAHKLGLTTFGKDINPVAAEAVRVALGPMDRNKIQNAFDNIQLALQPDIDQIYSTVDKAGKPATVLYFFWVMTAKCINCSKSIDLFSSYIISTNAYPKKKPEVQVFCPCCGDIFEGHYQDQEVECPQCSYKFNPRKGAVSGSKLNCTNCNSTQKISSIFKNQLERPAYRLYGKLVLTEDKKKEYIKVTHDDIIKYELATERLNELEQQGLMLPSLLLEPGYNTKQAINYNFKSWRDFFNNRQLLVLGLLHREILKINDSATRDALLTLFSSTLEFSNLFTSYKGEGTGAVRHMFAHHILKPERTPLETNIWGTEKSSGSFSGLFKTKLLRAITYRESPKEVNYGSEKNIEASSLPITGELTEWPNAPFTKDGSIYLDCGDSSNSKLPSASIDLVVTDPPFFDNVHYSELADFFYAWQTLHPRGFIGNELSTRQNGEVQDGDSTAFTSKLYQVFKECHRVLTDQGMMVFSYHHSREEGWHSMALAIQQAGFKVVNAHPIKAEMSGGKPKNQAKSPIQLDVIIVCRKESFVSLEPTSLKTAREIAIRKTERLVNKGFNLSENDKRVILYGQYLTTDYFLPKVAEFSL